MEEPAFLSDELDLEESDRIGAALDVAVSGQITKAELLETIEKSGQIEGVMESALQLTLEEYREVEAAWKAAPVPKKSKIRRRQK
jgi:hypothetical protein